MTLKEKLFNVIFDNAWEFKTENVVPECEQIADDYAIEFAEWLFDVSRIGTTEELLQIFKKQKGL